ncbi:carbohydrate-binding module family 13 protein [Punctularia strigosozonata HHB-11173 SS5]|uniref:carbohydrate-binding module family 13 protein n=1 Tax=Punctularia strigosozonata (strain HHB-11173) TaxID=741275 RepID=UPI0004416A94|nr:carbohydrate-binding module family 13 protein [Punctularia strigosozonata HHB-11173 SS5]EIN08697.1 carbohydrate-binding module family 13 protein [Punctularia strigosozonata HHB-11173 SS5]
MFSKSTLVAYVLSAVFVVAQTPAYTGQLLLEPGNSAAKCLRADDRNGAPVTLTSCTGASDQLWTFDNGQVKTSSNKCLDVTGGQDVDGVKLQVWDCSGSDANQKFYYTAYGDNHHGKCLDLPSGSLNDGTQVQLWTCDGGNPNQVWNVGYMSDKLPSQTESGQSGTNACGGASSQSSMCQTAWINDADDFCLWAPPNVGNIGDTEREEVAWCTKSGRGTRIIPDGTLQGVHFVRTPDYVQVTGVGDFTKINVPAGDSGGELDPHGADSRGNPVGGLVYGNTFGSNLQYHEWTSFISEKEFCFRACTGPNARENCQHIYDTMGCYWNMPANYDSGVFESCQADDDLPMGVYGTSTWYQGQSPTPAAHPPASSSMCTPFPSISVSPSKRDRMEKKRVPPVTSVPKPTMIRSPNPVREL